MKMRMQSQRKMKKILWLLIVEAGQFKILISPSISQTSSLKTDIENFPSNAASEAELYNPVAIREVVHPLSNL